MNRWVREWEQLCRYNMECGRRDVLTRRSRMGIDTPKREDEEVKGESQERRRVRKEVWKKR